MMIKPSPRVVLWVDEPPSPLPDLSAKVIALGDVLVVLAFRAQLRRMLAKM